MTSENDGRLHRRALFQAAGATALCAGFATPLIALAAAPQASGATLAPIVRKSTPLRLAPEQIKAFRPAAQVLSELKSRGLAPTQPADRYEFAHPQPPRPPQPLSPTLKALPAFSHEGSVVFNDGRPVTKFDKDHKSQYKQTPEPSASWQAYESPGDSSADTQIAVSTSHVVVTTHTTAAFFDRNGTTVKAPFSLYEFFGSSFMSSLGVNTIFDSRSIWDPYRKRFWIGTLAYQVEKNGKESSPPVRRTLMAVSVSENPLDGWWYDWWDSGENLSDTSDFLMFGVHEKCIVTCNNNTRLDGSYYHNVNFYDAQAMADGKSGQGWRIWNLVSATGATPDQVAPVVHHGSSPYLYLVGRVGDSLVVWGVQDPLGKSQKVVPFTGFPLSPLNSPPAAPQKDGLRKIWFNQQGNRVLSAVYRNGDIYAVLNDAADWSGDGQLLTSIRVMRFPMPEGRGAYIDRVFGGSSVFDDKPGEYFYYGFPAIDVGKNGDMVLVYSRSGTTAYPEARISSWPADQADISPSRLLKSGESAYHFYELQPPGWTLPTLPWADIAGCCVDPVDDQSVWVATCYATSQKDDNWGVWVGKVCARC